MKKHRGACLSGGHELRYRPNPNMAAVRHYENSTFLFFAVYASVIRNLVETSSIETSNITEIGVGNPFLILFLPSIVIVTLKGQGQGNFIYNFIHLSVAHIKYKHKKN